MARKKNAEARPENAPEPNSQDTNTATESPPEQVAPAPQNGQRAPTVTYSIQSDRTTRITVEVYVVACVTQQGESYERVETVFIRHFLSPQDGEWVRHNVFRTHDVPVLRFLIDRAYRYALERRTLDSSIPF